jgi:hypothetical protein
LGRVGSVREKGRPDVWNGRRYNHIEISELQYSVEPQWSQQLYFTAHSCLGLLDAELQCYCWAFLVKSEQAPNH